MLAARVLPGQEPANLPIEEVAVKKLLLNEKVAAKLNITFPANLKKEAE